MLATQSREKRQSFTAQFKLQVIREALQRPATNRIKPTCREHPEITPVRASPLLSRAIWGNRPVCPVSSAGCAAFLSVLAVSAGATAQVDTQPRGPRTRAANSQVPCEGERQRRHEATSLPQYQEARRGGGFLGARESDGRDPVIRGHDSRPNGRCSLGPLGGNRPLDARQRNPDVSSGPFNRGRLQEAKVRDGCEHVIDPGIIKCWDVSGCSPSPAQTAPAPPQASTHARTAYLARMCIQERGNPPSLPSHLAPCGGV